MRNQDTLLKHSQRVQANHQTHLVCAIQFLLLDLIFSTHTYTLVFHRLKESAWIDGLTQVVFLEFTLFNPASQMFQTAMFAYEVPDFGGVSLIQSNLVRSYGVYPFTSSSAAVALL